MSVWRAHHLLDRRDDVWCKPSIRDALPILDAAIDSTANPQNSSSVVSMLTLSCNAY
jgi:hypothetical protein